MRRALRVLAWVAGGFFTLVVLVLLVGWVVSEGYFGSLHERGAVVQSAVPEAAVAQRRLGQDPVSPEGAGAGQILFGDLHVHTTFSADAFLFSLPMFQGEGVHPPADACDFARFCAQLDFFSLNDHAEFLTPRQWQETKESIRECNAVAGEERDPDLVAFLGWEWTQAANPFSTEEQSHYGHKNVILLDTAEDRVPTRPIGAQNPFAVDAPEPVWAAVRAGLAIPDLPELSPYLDFNRWNREYRGVESCPKDVAVRDLPANCIEEAASPDLLFAKLDDWGFESLVIPHGTTWGIHAPPGSSLATQLEPGLHDPKRQRLFEVYSGHGNSERYHEMLEYTVDEEGKRHCAEPRDSYLPCCWRAGEIIAERCASEGLPEPECASRVRRAREYMAEAEGMARLAVVPGTRAEDWLECGQLPQGFLPAYDYRPKMSAQYGLAARGFAPDGTESAFRYGLIGSSDNHKARAGPGYKEIARKAYGDAYFFNDRWYGLLTPDAEVSSQPIAPKDLPLGQGTDRNVSYYYTAGLVAVHAAGREREAIWNALHDRHVYGTSGDRILLWFDLENAPDDAIAPMGSEVTMSGVPRFSVRAAGAFEQLPGCPSFVSERLTPERLARLCLEECYHASDVRKRMDRIEVVRIRPQVRAGEPIEPLIEDPWRTFPCDPESEVCTVEFEDPEFVAGQREFVYYVRALQEPSLAVNGDPMRCERDAEGVCQQARPCPAGGPDFEPTDDCLSPVQERAWSSPIFVRPAA